MLDRFLSRFSRCFGMWHYWSVQGSVAPTAQLIRAAHYSLRVVSGELNGALWLAPPVRDALLSAIDCEPPVRIEIIFGPPSAADPSALDFFGDLARRPNVTLYVLSARATKHFAITDGMHVKQEEFHPPNAPRRSGFVSFNMPRLATVLSEQFDLYKLQATPYEPP
jgi:hypothetical protein